MSSNHFLDLNKYEKKEKIGSGSFGDVFTVMNKETKIIYAAKISQNEISSELKENLVNFTREVNIISQIIYPSILQFIGFSPIDFDSKPHPVIVTEYLPIGCLEDAIDSKLDSKGWNETKILINIYGVASAMAFLHSHKILHRDLKPHNILLDSDLYPKIADFGLSKITDKQTEDTLAAQSMDGLKGTVNYMSPEVIESQEYKPACDVYSFSIIIYQLMVEKVPYPKFNIYQIMNKVASNYRPKFTHEIPDVYKKLIERCWDQSADLRPTFDQIVNELRTNELFVTEKMDKEEFLKYIQKIDKSEKSYNRNKRVFYSKFFDCKSENEDSKEKIDEEGQIRIEETEAKGENEQEKEVKIVENEEEEQENEEEINENEDEKTPDKINDKDDEKTPINIDEIKETKEDNESNKTLKFKEADNNKNKNINEDNETIKNNETNDGSIDRKKIFEKRDSNSSISKSRSEYNNSQKTRSIYQPFNQSRFNIMSKGSSPIRITDRSATVSVKSGENMFYPMSEIYLLNEECQLLLQKAENSPTFQFEVGASLVEGIEGFPHKPDVGIQYLKKSIEYECIESVLSDADSNSIIIFDSLVELLTSFLEMINRQDESQYSNIAPFVQLLTDNSEFSPSQKMLGVNLFGKLVIICPQSASGDIDNFIKFSLELFSEDDSETNKMIVEFLNTIASNQSKCLEPYVADVFESLINQIDVSEEQLKALLLNQENEEEEEEDQNEDVEYVSPTKSIYDMQGCILALLSTICSIYPTQTCNYFEKVHSLLETYINSRDPDLAISAIEDFGYLSEAYVTIGSDVDGLLKTLIEQLSDPDMLYVDIVAELWKGISVVLANAGSQLIKQRSAEIVNILDSVLFKRKNYYNEKGDVEEIGLIFRHPVFMVLDIFIEELGIESLQYIEQFIEVLDTMANNRQKNTHCFAARSLAKIGSILPPDDENGDRFINLALQIGLDDIKQKTVTMQICGFSTIYIVLNHRPDLIDPIKSDLLDFTASIMKRCSAGAPENIDVLSECSILFLSIVRVFNLVDDSIIDMISEATQYAKLDIDSPNLIPFALFASFIIQYGQEEYMDFYLYVVLLILSSSQMILRKIEPDTLIEFAKAISSLPEEEIVGKSQWNLTKFEILQRNVANILGEGQES